MKERETQEERETQKECGTKEKKGGVLLPDRFVLRCIVLIFGLAVMALGVAFSIKSSLGTSPISSVPYVLSLITPLTVGNVTIAMHCFFILLQILILRRNYQLLQLLQLPVAIIFGYLTDAFVWLIRGLDYSSYLQQWIYCVIGILFVAMGVTLEVLAGVVTLAGEGLVLALCQVLPVKFGNMKVGFDVTLVVIACVISFVGTGGLNGVREGTVAAALLVGSCSKVMMKPVKKVTDKIIPAAE